MPDEHQYTNARTKLKCKCSVGHIYEVTWNNWQRGRRCPKCEDRNFSIKFSGQNSWHWKNYSKEDLAEICNYKNEVRRLSDVNYREYKFIVNPLDLPRARNEYHLDHIYSLMDGFENKVPPEIIAHPINLQMLPEDVNIAKRNNSSMSLEKLYSKHNNWEEENAV